MLKGLLFVGVMVVTVGVAPNVPCDLAKTEAAHFCSSCENVWAKTQLVSEVTYYECEKCGHFAKAAGKCGDCKEERVQKKSGKDVCKICYETPAAVEACVKTYYGCAKCKKVSARAGDCEPCKEKLVRRARRALVTHECAECGEVELKAGNCTDEDCPAEGKPLRKTCGQSGVFPHVGKKPKK